MGNKAENICWRKNKKDTSSLSSGFSQLHSFPWAAASIHVLPQCKRRSTNFLLSLFHYKKPHGTSYLKSHPNLRGLYCIQPALTHMALAIPLFSSKAFRGGFHGKKWDNGASDRLESSRGWDEPRLQARERHKTGAFANPAQCGAFAPGKKDTSKQHSAIFAVQWTELRSDIEWHSIKSTRSKELTEAGSATQPSLEAPNILSWLSEEEKEKEEEVAASSSLE